MMKKMNRKNRFPAWPLVCCVLFLAGYAQSPGPMVQIQKVLIQPSPVSPKIILQTDGKLNVSQAAYSLILPRTLVLDLANAGIPPDLEVTTGGEPLFEEVKFVPNGQGLLRLFLSLKEQAFFRVTSAPGQTVLEMNKILDPQTEDVIDPSFRLELSQRSIVTSGLGNVSVAREDGSVRVQAAVDNRTPYHVFAMSNPLRLVVDLFDTVYNRPTSLYSVGAAGVSKFKVGQFQNQNPFTITRLVFDMDEPGAYSIDAGERLLTLIFPGSQTITQPAPAAESVSVPGPVSSPAAAPPEPEKARAETPAEPSAKETVKPAAGPGAETKPAQDKSAEKPAAEFAGTQFKAQVLGGEVTPYSGEVLSVKVKDQDLRDIILYLGDFAGLNVIFDPDVRGRVTCNFEYVPWDQILDAILRTNKMGKVLEGNVLRIAPVAVLTRESDEDVKMQESRELSGPLLTKTFTLSYSKARDAERLLQQKKSNRGRIDVDERTNTLIVSEARSRMELLEKLIILMDTPTPQVSIEARIVEATSNFVRNLGFQWGFMGRADAFYGNQTNLQFPNQGALDGALIPRGQVTKGLSGPLGGYAINLPAPTFTTALGLSLANVLDTFRLDATLSAMETSGQGRIISCPKVTAQNNKEAEIVQGRQIPIQTVSNFTVTTRFVNAALELRATPQITAEGTIIMNIDIQNNAADFSNAVNGIPSITRQSAMTTVMIPDGGTTVIGGIYRTEDSTTQERVPLLHKIPILGNLFKSSARTRQNRELLIFITPRILRQGGQP